MSAEIGTIFRKGSIGAVLVTIYTFLLEIRDRGLLPMSGRVNTCLSWEMTIMSGAAPACIPHPLSLSASTNHGKCDWHAYTVLPVQDLLMSSDPRTHTRAQSLSLSISSDPSIYASYIACRQAVATQTNDDGFHKKTNDDGAKWDQVKCVYTKACRQGQIKCCTRHELVSRWRLQMNCTMGKAFLNGGMQNRKKRKHMNRKGIEV